MSPFVVHDIAPGTTIVLPIPIAPPHLGIASILFLCNIRLVLLFGPVSVVLRLTFIANASLIPSFRAPVTVLLTLWCTTPIILLTWCSLLLPVMWCNPVLCIHVQWSILLVCRTRSSRCLSPAPSAQLLWNSILLLIAMPIRLPQSGSWCINIRLHGRSLNFVLLLIMKLLPSLNEKPRLTMLGLAAFSGLWTCCDMLICISEVDLPKLFVATIRLLKSTRLVHAQSFGPPILLSTAIPFTLRKLRTSGTHKTLPPRKVTLGDALPRTFRTLIGSILPARPLCL